MSLRKVVSCVSGQGMMMLGRRFNGIGVGVGISVNCGGSGSDIEGNFKILLHSLLPSLLSTTTTTNTATRQVRAGSSGTRAKTTNTQSLKYSHLSGRALQVLHVIGSSATRHFRHYIVQDLQFATRKHAVQTLPDADHNDQHQGEENGGALEGFNHPQDDQASQLDECKEMDAFQGNLEEQKKRTRIRNRNLETQIKHRPVAKTCSPAGI